MNKLYIPILVMMAFISQSCSDFLEEEPLDEASVEQFFSDPAHATAAVNSLYQNGGTQMFNGGVYSGTRLMWVQHMSGFFDNEYSGQEVQVLRAQQLTLDGNNTAGYIDNIWLDLYRGISRANNAIKYIPTTPDLSEESIRQLSAEAKFFRAYAYYYLVRMFGAVPLITEPFESLEGIYTERSTVADIYNLIVTDLEYAVNEGGLTTDHMSENENRITGAVAATLLSEVYLTMAGYPLQQANRYADAATLARRIINGEFGSYALTQHSTDGGGNVDPANSAYNKIRQSDISPEYIYFKEYTAGITNSPYAQWTYPLAIQQSTLYDITNGAYQPEEEFLWLYDPDRDLRIQNKQYYHWTISTGEGEVTFEPTPYIWHDDAALFTGPPASSKDVAIYTYADVLLIAAEAIAKSEGVTAEATDYLAQVRARAYWQEDFNTIKDGLSALSVTDFEEEVWAERIRELVFEFHLWFDILRTRKYPVATEANRGDITFVDLVGHTNPQGSTYAERHLLFPISENEIQRNPGLGDNNPGY